MGSTLLILTADEASAPVREALCASAERLGHAAAPAFISLDGIGDLELAVHEVDPWTVVAADAASVAALAAAFGDEARGFAADHPVIVRGYTFVAVPGFEECLGNQEAKRIAWGRLQAAKHPSIPY